MSYFECEHFAVMPLYFLSPLSYIYICKVCCIILMDLQGEEADAEDPMSTLYSG